MRRAPVLERAGGGVEWGAEHTNNNSIVAAQFISAISLVSYKIR